MPLSIDAKHIRTFIKEGFSLRFYCEEAEAVLRDVDSTSEGLTSAEAEKRLAAYGKNKLAEGKKDSLIKRFF